MPFRFHGLTIIGDMFFLLNIVFFVMNWTAIGVRFYFWPETLKNSFLHPTESLFVPASIVSFGTILINISQYGLHHTGDWLLNAVEALFWIDCILAILFSAGIYLLLWSTQYFSVEQVGISIHLHPLCRISCHAIYFLGLSLLPPSMERVLLYGQNPCNTYPGSWHAYSHELKNIPNIYLPALNRCLKMECRCDDEIACT